MKKSLLQKVIIGALFVLTVFAATAIAASTGTIDPNNNGDYIAKFLDTNAVSNVNINFGKYTTESQYDVTVSDSELRGYAWGSSVGYIVLNCADTTSGCTATNGNFKVSNDGQGKLSGYAWGQDTGWINFGPFTDASISTVKIGSDGNFTGTLGSAGYAWSQSYGWIVFDCSNGACVNTDWRPAGGTTTPPGGGGGTTGGGGPGGGGPGVPVTPIVVPPNYIGVVASSIMCDTESAMPHWAQGGSTHPNIDANSAINFVNSSNGHCQFISGQSFQWANPGTGDGGAIYGPSPKYNTFGPTDWTGTTQVITPITTGNPLPLREVLPLGFTPFSSYIYHNNNNTPTAEFYCETDGVNYDNLDYINTQQSQKTYYCISFNTPLVATTHPTDPNNPPTNPGNPSNPTGPTGPTNPGNPTGPTSPTGPTNPITGPTEPPPITPIEPGDNPTQSPDQPLFPGLTFPPGLITGLGQITDNIGNIINTIVKIAKQSPVINKTASEISVATTAIVALATLLFANPFALSELFLLPFRLWTLLLIFFGLKKNRPWGTVYDSVTKQPIDPAYVVLMDMAGNEVSTSITDIDGRYGFSVPAGTYKIIANKTNFVFPSVKLAGRKSDELYDNLYFGDEIVISKEGDVIINNIPMDQLNFDWNEFAKNEQKRLSYFHRNDLLIARISNFFFWFGFLVATISILVSQTILNGVVFIIYILLFLIRHYSPVFKPKGTITDSTGQLSSFAIVRVLSAATGQEITHKVADRLGSYYCLVPNGQYNIIIDRKNPDASYTKIAIPGTVTVRQGYLKKDFKI